MAHWYNQFFIKTILEELSGYLEICIAALSPTLLEHFPKPKDIKDSSLFSYLVSNAIKNKIRVFSYNTSEYIKDIKLQKDFLELKKT